MKVLRTAKRVFLALLAVMMLSLTSGSELVSAQANGVYCERLGITDKNACVRALRQQNIAFVDPFGPEGGQCPVEDGAGIGFGSTVAGKKVFVFGDSLTVGMTNSGGLLDKISAQGFSVDTAFTPQFDRSVVLSTKGNSVEATGGWALLQMNNLLDAQKTRPEKVQPIKDADVILVALGTNPDVNFASQVSTFMNLLRNDYGSTAQIVWLNTYYKPSRRLEPYTVINQKIAEAAQVHNFSIIDIAAATPNTVPEPNADTIHFTGEGYQQRAEWVAQQLKAVVKNGGISSLTNGSGDSDSTKTTTIQSIPSGCTCPTGTNTISLSLSKTERYKIAWTFFTSNKRLSPEAAAGLMGNLEAESGIDPHNMQNNAPLPDGPEMPSVSVAGQLAPDPAIAGKYGYGIAQWTSVGRQANLLRFAKEQGKSSGDLGLQLDFLWKELSEAYTSVLATLQTPGVTLEEASAEVLLNFEIPASVILPPRGTSTIEARERTIASRAGLSNNILNTYRSVADAYTGTPSCGIAGLVNPGAQDQSSVQCAEGTQDAGVVKGYAEGKETTIRLCRVADGTVNAQISGAMKKLLEDASAAGIPLKMGSTFRSMEEQITTYVRWCGSAGKDPSPGPFPYPNSDDAVDCPGAAAPGYSNHQMGLAIDFMCDNRSIPQSYQEARSNQCFQWLVENAAKYGLYEYGKGNRTADGYEAWHWSVDGS